MFLSKINFINVFLFLFWLCILSCGQKRINCAGCTLEETIQIIDDSGDSLSILSKDFLVSNMCNKYSFTLAPFDQSFNFSKYSQSEIDSIYSVFSNLFYNQRATIEFDDKSITGKLFLDNIDHSKDVYLRKNKTLDDDFFHYVLPYRFLTEPLSDFKKDLYKEVKNYCSTKSFDLEHECLLSYCHSFSISDKYKDMLNHQSIATIIHDKSGDQNDLVLFQMAVFSSFGYPVRIIEVNKQKKCGVKIDSQWGYIDNSKGINFTDKLEGINESVFTYSYRLSDLLSFFACNPKNIPSDFYLNKKNITNEFIKTVNYTFDREALKTNDSVLYLMCFNQNGWRFDDWSILNNEKFDFTNLLPGFVYKTVLYPNLSDSCEQAEKIFYLSNDKVFKLFSNCGVNNDEKLVISLRNNSLFIDGELIKAFDFDIKIVDLVEINNASELLSGNDKGEYLLYQGVLYGISFDLGGEISKFLIGKAKSDDSILFELFNF